MFKRKLIVILILLLATAHPAWAIKYKGDLESNESVTFPEQSSKPTSPAATKHKLYVKDDGSLYQLDSSGTEKRAALTGYKNKLINGNFRLWQRGTAATAMGVQYLADRWGRHNFQNGSYSRQDFVASGEHPGNSRYVSRVAGDATATISRLSISQGIESWDTYGLRGKTVTLSGFVRFSAATITGASNWNVQVGYTNASGDAALNSSDYTAGAATTITYAEGTTPTIWTKFTVSTTIGAAANNAVVNFSFTNATDLAATDWYELSQVQLEIGPVATEFEQRPIGLEWTLAERYYQKTFPTDTAPAQIAGVADALCYNALLAGVNKFNMNWYFKTPMRTDPTVTYYNPSAANTKFRNTPDAGDSGTPATDVLSPNYLFIRNPQVATDGVGEQVCIHATADAEL